MSDDMKIKMLIDYRGVLTGEHYYSAGVYDVPDGIPPDHAEALIGAGHAIEQKPEPKPTAAKPIALHYGKMTVAQLRTEAKARGIDIPPKTRKADLVAMLEESGQQ